MGERQANDSNAMPLEKFIEEVMQILKDHPEDEEILVKAVKPMREASFHGMEHYKEAFMQQEKKNGICYNNLIQ